MKESFRKYTVPFSGRRYYVDELGNVCTSDAVMVPARIVDGQKIVELDWLFGRRDYAVGTLVLVANGHFRDFPEYLLDRVEPLFKDSDPSNTRLSNLTYRFKEGPLEVEDHPGYFYVPFYTRYGISRDGQLITAAAGHFNRHVGVVRSWAIMPPDIARGKTGGYRYLRAVTDNGDSKVLFRHQALCWTFKPYEANVRDLVINHLDGAPGSDSLDNLEITTYRENSLHAIRTGLRGKARAVVMRNLRTGAEHTCNTINDCLTIYPEIPHWAVIHRMNDSVARERVYSDYWVFRRIGDTDSFPEYIDGATPVYRATEDRAVIARDIHDGRTTIGKSYTQLGEGLGLSAAVIRSRVVSDDPKPFKGYCFKFLDDNRGWPVFTDRQLAIHLKYRDKDRVPDGILVFDTVSKTELFFCSRQKAAEHFKISPVTVYALAHRSEMFRTRYKFQTFEVNGNLTWSHWPETVNEKPL